MLVACYVVNYVLFRVFFDYRLHAGRAGVRARRRIPADCFQPGTRSSSTSRVSPAMFLMINFDLWPLTKSGAVMRQPVLGVVWTVAALVLGGAAFYVGVVMRQMDPAAFMVRVPVPFIFGTIVVQNMLKGSLFAKHTQPVKGLLNVVAVIVIGESLSWMYGRLAPLVTGIVRPGPPTYDLRSGWRRRC